MKRFLVVGSRDLTEYANGRSIPHLIASLCKKENEVLLFLLENGVIAARDGSNFGGNLTELSEKGARIFAEDVSCRARGIKTLAPGVDWSDLDFLADSIAKGFDNIVWY